MFSKIQQLFLTDIAFHIRFASVWTEPLNDVKALSTIDYWLSTAVVITTVGWAAAPADKYISDIISWWGITCVRWVWTSQEAGQECSMGNSLKALCSAGHLHFAF